MRTRSRRGSGAAGRRGGGCTARAHRRGSCAVAAHRCVAPLRQPLQHAQGTFEIDHATRNLQHATSSMRRLARMQSVGVIHCGHARDRDFVAARDIAQGDECERRAVGARVLDLPQKHNNTKLRGGTGPAAGWHWPGCGVALAWLRGGAGPAAGWGHCSGGPSRWVRTSGSRRTAPRTVPSPRTPAKSKSVAQRNRTSNADVGETPSVLEGKRPSRRGVLEYQGYQGT